MAVVAADPLPLKIVLGEEPDSTFSVDVPVLAGEPVEVLFRDLRLVSRRSDGFRLFETAGWRFGVVSLPAGASLEAISHRAYREVFQVLHGWHPARIWNYVPGINAIGPGGLENYRTFCRGRSLAFEEFYGPGFKASVSAASAVGCQSPTLTVVFAACAVAPRHVENPLQVPAYDYPSQYGPRAPSFARATVVPDPARPAVFVSGTSAIRGHATVAPENTREQLTCTLENLRQISLACGLGPDLASGAMQRHFKIYLRHPSEQPVIADVLNQNLLRAGDHVSYLHADICRRQLNVEIEMTAWGTTLF
jgi:chorismate lyase/3-hydroxybenzoate synthase